MTRKHHIRSYCNPQPRLSASAQEARLTGEVYTENKRGTAFTALFKSLRPGDVVEVLDLYVLPPATLKTFRRRRVLTERVEAIAAAGAVLVELSTGDRSDKGHTPRMMMRAYEMIGKAGQGYTGTGRKGRPPKQRSVEELRIMEFEWVNKCNKTIDDALLAMTNRGIKRHNQAELYRRFGSRNAGKVGK